MSRTRAFAAPQERVKPDTGRTRRSAYPGLLTFILALCMVAGAYLYASRVDSRLTVLEAIIINAHNELVEVRDRIHSSGVEEGRYTSIAARVQSLEQDAEKMEERLGNFVPANPALLNITPSASAANTAGASTEIPETTMMASQSGNAAAETAAEPEQSGASETGKIHDSAIAELQYANNKGTNVTASTTLTNAGHSQQENKYSTTPAPNRPRNIVVVEEGIERITEQAGRNVTSNSPVENPATGTAGNTSAISAGSTVDSDAGKWVINLLSSTSRDDAVRLADKAIAKNIAVEINKAVLNGNEYWRLQITGFPNEGKARAYAGSVKQELEINDVWIFRQTR